MSFSNVWQVPGSGAEIYENVFVPAMMAEWAPKAIALIHPEPMVIDEVSQTLNSFVGAQGLEYPIEAILAFARK